MKSRIPFIAALMLLPFALCAQPQGERPEPPKKQSPAEMAKVKADMMQAEVNLDKKQYKKVYKLFKKDFQYRQDAMEQNRGGMPPMGGPVGGMMGDSGMGGPGGGPGMGGGMMGGPGGGPGMGGGMSPQGNQQMGQRHEGGPMMGPGPAEDVITEEYLEKQDTKLRKILTPDQYSRWRSKHPAERIELPPFEYKNW